MIRHVLLDADGVMQHFPGGWVAALEEHVGADAEEFFRAASEDERACLRGEGDFLAVLARHLEARGVPVTADALHRAVWRSVHVEPSSVALVHALRDAGLRVHLGTNQEGHRASYMRTELAYDDLFDESFYSCDLGAAKPDAAFFTAVLDSLGAAAPEVLFVDDSEPNVVSARECGLAAEHWRIDDGIDTLRGRLGAHGLSLT